MHSTKKGGAWHFGYKAHVGVDKDNGLVHTLKIFAVKLNFVFALVNLILIVQRNVDFLLAQFSPVKSGGLGGFGYKQGRQLFRVLPAQI